MSGKLYLVATPIGNLDDITIRAWKVLKEVDLIAAEDTRHTLGLLNHFEISKPLISYYKEIENTKSDVLLDKIIKENQNVALVSDAGTPGISDPGEVIVKKAIEKGIEVIPIPGACAMINALITSGLSTREFTFVGFLSANAKERKEKLEELKYESRTLVFYEAPHKLKESLKSMQEILGNRKVVLAREITKIHEEFIRGELSTISEEIGDTRGEYVVLVEGSIITKKDKELEDLNNLSLEEHYKKYEEEGLSKKDIIKKIAKDRKTDKNKIYQYFIDK